MKTSQKLQLEATRIKVWQAALKKLEGKILPAAAKKMLRAIEKARRAIHAAESAQAEAFAACATMTALQDQFRDTMNRIRKSTPEITTF
jgi:DNA-binding transcriptional LysR family regulator